MLLTSFELPSLLLPCLLISSDHCLNTKPFPCQLAEWALTWNTKTSYFPNTHQQALSPDLPFIIFSAVPLCFSDQLTKPFSTVQESMPIRNLSYFFLLKVDLLRLCSLELFLLTTAFQGHLWVSLSSAAMHKANSDLFPLHQLIIWILNTPIVRAERSAGTKVVGAIRASLPSYSTWLCPLYLLILHPRHLTSILIPIGSAQF